jgi:hypothetical protein
MQVTDKRIHQVKIELSLKECYNLRRTLDHYLKLYDGKMMEQAQQHYVEESIDVDALRAMSSHLVLVETSDVVEEMGR